MSQETGCEGRLKSFGHYIVFLYVKGFWTLPISEEVSLLYESGDKFWKLFKKFQTLQSQRMSFAVF